MLCRLTNLGSRNVNATHLSSGARIAASFIFAHPAQKGLGFRQDLILQLVKNLWKASFWFDTSSRRIPCLLQSGPQLYWNKYREGLADFESSAVMSDPSILAPTPFSVVVVSSAAKLLGTVGIRSTNVSLMTLQD